MDAARAGVKLSEQAFGLRLEGSIDPDLHQPRTTSGWWCDPFWGCYLVGDAQYANRFELAGGITFRFE